MGIQWLLLMRLLMLSCAVAYNRNVVMLLIEKQDLFIIFIEFIPRLSAPIRVPHLKPHQKQSRRGTIQGCSARGCTHLQTLPFSLVH